MKKSTSISEEKKFFDAISNNMPALVKFLVEHRDQKVTNIALILAVHNCNLEVLSYLISKVSDSITWSYAVFKAAADGNIECLDLLFKYYYTCGDKEIVKKVFTEALGTALDYNQNKAAKFIYSRIF